MNCRKVYCLAVVGALCMAVLWITRFGWLDRLYTVLDVSQAPHQADVIVILGGETTTRVLTAVELYNQNFAPQVLLSGGSWDVQQGVVILEEAGIPSQDIILNEPAGESTWEEAQRILSILDEREVSSALIVTNRWHTKRAAATYRALQDDRSLEITFVATLDEYFRENNWWQTRWGRILISQEYIKLAYYLLRYGVIPV